MDESISINKFISSTGVCSRREADSFIEQGRVYINGKLARKGNRVLPGDEVIFDGMVVKTKKKSKSVYIILNKPIGITCTTDKKDKDNIIDFVNHQKRIFPVGRLDKDSSGLIMLTNDGDIVNKILRSENKHEKEYLVTVHKGLTSQFLDSLRKGVPILGKMTKQCKVVRKTNYVFSITLVEGMNRQIRRMCNHFDYKVLNLHRIRIMNIGIEDLRPGAWRTLHYNEMKELMERMN